MCPLLRVGRLARAKEEMGMGMGPRWTACWAVRMSE